MPHLLVDNEMLDQRDLEFLEVLVDWNSMTVWVNGPKGCLLRAVKCKNILVEARKTDNKPTPV